MNETQKRITTFVDAADGDSQPADCAIIFGVSLPEPAHIAAELFHAGIVRHIVTTGGPRRDDPTFVEAERHADILRARRVPERAIIIEAKSSTTLENAEFARRLITARLGEVQSLIAVTFWFHRRAMLALERYFPSVERIDVVTYEPVIGGELVSRLLWPETQNAYRVLQEYHRLRELDSPHLRMAATKPKAILERLGSEGNLREDDRLDRPD